MSDLKILHTHKTNYYQIKRPCFWFCVGDRIPCSVFAEYFTPKAITSLLQSDFISIIY